MKKLMMGTAIALLASTGVASAQEWNVDVGGFFEGGFGYVEIDDDNDSTGLSRNSEIYIDASLVADNGLTFGAGYQIEADGSENTDENWAYVSGSFGKFEIGEQDGAADKFKYVGSVYGPFGAASDGVGMLFDYYGADSRNALDAYGADTSDSLKLTYYTPSFAGFSAGVSYVPNATITNGDGNGSDRNSGDDAWEFGLGYDGEFSGVTFGLGAGYTAFGGTSDEAGTGDYGLGVSGKLGYGGFLVGVAYSITDGKADDGGELSTLAVGATYETGPWTFGGDVAFQLDDASLTDRANATVAGQQTGAALSVAYALAPGVSVGVGGEWLDPDNGDDDAYAVSSFLGLAF